MEHGGAEAFFCFLLNHDWGDIDLRNPPKTYALKEQMVQGMNPMQLWWMERLLEGGVNNRHDTFVSFSSLALNPVEKLDVWHSLEKALRGSYAGKAIESKGGKFLREHVPGLQEKRAGEGDYRRMMFLFPTLEAMRHAFKIKYDGLAPWENRDRDTLEEWTMSDMLAMQKRAAAVTRNVNGWDLGFQQKCRRALDLTFDAATTYEIEKAP